MSNTLKAHEYERAEHVTTFLKNLGFDVHEVLSVTIAACEIVVKTRIKRTRDIVTHSLIFNPAHMREDR